MKYQVRLNCPTVMWAIVEVEAASESEAEEKALAANAEGTVSYEDAGFDTADAEVTDVEEVEEDRVAPSPLREVADGRH